MKAGVPWSVKGIEPATRAAAKAAARRAGMTLGEWLSHKIKQPGDTEMASRLGRTLEEFDRLAPDDPHHPGAASYDWPETPGPSNELTLLLERLDRLESQHGDAIVQIETAVTTLAARLRQVGRANDAAVAPAALERRVASLETDGALTLARIDKAIDAVSQRSERMEAQLDKLGADTRSAAQTYEAAFGALAKRIGSVDERQREQGRLLEQAVSQLTERLQLTLVREDTGQIEAVRTLEHAVEEITRHFEGLETRREATQRLVESALSALADRVADADRRLGRAAEPPIEAIDRAVERMQARLQESDRRTSDTLAAFDARLRDVNERLQSGDVEFRATRTAMALALGDAQQKIEGLTTSPAAAPEPADEPREAESAEARADALQDSDKEPAEEQVSLPVSLESLFDDTSETRAYADHDLSDLFERQERAPSVPEAPEASEDAEERPGEQLSDDVKALLGAARAMARAEDPAMAAAPEDAAAWDDTAESEAARALPDATPTRLLSDHSAASFERASPLTERIYRDPDLTFGQRYKKQIAVVLGLCAGVALGAFWLAQHDGGKDSLSATRPGLAPSLFDAVRRFADGSRANVDPHPPAAPPSSGSTARPSGEPPSAKKTEVAPPARRIGPPPSDTPAVASKTPAPSADELQAYATQAIAALKVAATPAEEAAAAQRVGRAAALGNADAQFALGRLYETGRSVVHDADTARRWYTEAASRGNAEAAFNLGMMEIAKGGDGAYDRAARYFRDAAENGNVDAQVNLALLYEQGLGVPRDDAQALSWYSKAAQRGDPEATRARDRLAKRGMTER